MIIQTASVKNLHGHLNPKLSLKRDVNILIGVNGSGKTSILNAVAWTLSPASVQGGLPAAYLLSILKFEEINIAYSIPGVRKYQRVKASRTEEAVVIEVAGIDNALEIPIVANPDFTFGDGGRRTEESVEFVVRSMDDQRNNPVLKHLNELPGPLYLPLDRRWTEESTMPPRLRAGQRPRTRSSTTAGHLPIGEVLALAERAFEREQYETYRLNEALRTRFLILLFEVYDFFASDSRVWTMEELGERRERVVKTLQSLGLGNVQEVSEKFFSGLEDVVGKLGGQIRPDNWLEDPKSDVWVEWMLRASPIALRIERLISLIEEYESDRSYATRRSTNFLDSVNRFLSDNGKKLEFLREFQLGVELPNGQKISSQNLSSGELQLLILFTFLYFQFDDPNEEFVVLVDEPELSLHVAWQNRYIESVRTANPNAQFIIATHSPEIVGEARESVIDISPRVKANAGI